MTLYVSDTSRSRWVAAQANDAVRHSLSQLWPYLLHARYLRAVRAENVNSVCMTHLPMRADACQGSVVGNTESVVANASSVADRLHLSPRRLTKRRCHAKCRPRYCPKTRHVPYQRALRLVCLSVGETVQSTQAFALVGRRYRHGLTVLGYGASCNLYPFSDQRTGDLAI